MRKTARASEETGSWFKLLNGIQTEVHDDQMLISLFVRLENWVADQLIEDFAPIRLPTLSNSEATTSLNV
jgi:hypothetical protein